MNAILSLGHFCETHGPTVLFSTQAFHVDERNEESRLDSSKVHFFGHIKKLEDYKSRALDNSEYVICEACNATTGYITNDYQNRVSFLSTRTAVDSNVSPLMQQAAVRSLSCEVVPEKEGQIYFGDSTRGHVLSSTFFLKDAEARGFHRWYSFLVFMRDKHLLLNSWPYFERHARQMIEHLQRNAAQVYNSEENVCSQRVLRLSGVDRKHASTRSLAALTNDSAVFARLHLWFTWLLSTGAKRLEELTPFKLLHVNRTDLDSGRGKDLIWHLRKMRRVLGAYDFQRIIYSTLIGRQIIIRGPETLVELIINLLRLILPSGKFRCIEYSETYHGPDECNILGLNLFAAVPKSSEFSVRLDIVPVRDISNRDIENLKEAYCHYNFLVKSESRLPSKLPSLLLKIDKTLSDESLNPLVTWIHVKSMIEQWEHVSDIIRESKRKKNDSNWPDFVQFLGVNDQDERLIDFWSR